MASLYDLVTVDITGSQEINERFGYLCDAVSLVWFRAQDLGKEVGMRAHPTVHRHKCALLLPLWRLLTPIM